MKIRKKPIIQEAIQYDGENEEEVYKLFGAENFVLLGDGDGFMLSFNTAHGDGAYARPGDWITPDVEPGTFYPIKDDVIKANFEILEEESDGEHQHADNEA